MLKIGCIADDFTGAGDAASFLRRGGLRTVYLSGDRLGSYVPGPETEALVIALKCRSIPAHEAVEQVTQAARWLLRQGAEHLYYKYCSTFDSTPEGNIGPVTDALLELLDAPYTLLCPALPINGRTVRGGVLYVNGVPLADSPMRHHPLNPMNESELVKLMAPQSRYPCFSLPLEELYGPDPAGKAAEYARAGRCSLAVDYTRDRDGMQIARSFAALPLLTGGSGLLEHLGRVYKGEDAAENSCRVPLADSRRLLLAGSCSEMTLRQVAAFQAAGGESVKIEPLKLVNDDRSLERLLMTLDRAKGDILFYSSEETEQVARNQSLGAERISAVLEDCMGRLALHAAEQGFLRIVVAGGETSGRVMLSLGYEAYEILEDVAPGVPRMVPVEKPELSLALKSGNFGREDFFLTALK